MALVAEQLTRKFIYNGTQIPDPNPALPISDVQNLLAQTHPEIANAAIEGPKQKGSVQEYTFIRSVGTKG